MHPTCVVHFIIFNSCHCCFCCREGWNISSEVISCYTRGGKTSSGLIDRKSFLLLQCFSLAVEPILIMIFCLLLLVETYGTLSWTEIMLCISCILVITGLRKVLSIHLNMLLVVQYINYFKKNHSQPFGKYTNSITI